MLLTEVDKGIYMFQIALPNNPLRWLNCYVIKGDKGERNLLIDSGFHREECLKDLLEGINELGIDPKDTDVFFTHAHSDHTGNGFELAELGCNILMGEIDYEVMRAGHVNSRWEAMADAMGIPSEIRVEVLTDNPANKLKPRPFEAQFIKCGEDVLSYGGRKLECILTPGHTPGHICLYDRNNKLMFTGDHVLFDITPNITWLGDYPSLLRSYLGSLDEISKYDIRIALPAHRTAGDKTIYQRISEIKKHHEERLAEVVKLVHEHPEGITSYELAGLMTWRIRSKNWEEFPAPQKWFAVGESVAHLEYLEEEKLVTHKVSESGTLIYYPC